MLSVVMMGIKLEEEKDRKELETEKETKVVIMIL